MEWLKGQAEDQKIRHIQLAQKKRRQQRKQEAAQLMEKKICQWTEARQEKKGEVCRRG